MYIITIAVLFFTRDPRIWRAVLVPAVVFCFGTFLRAVLNFPRPYEVYHTPALVDKDRKGQSFPSRHMFSASVLTVCAWWLWPPLGAVMAVIVLILAPMRVLVGVHFVRDVVAGVLLGGLLGWLGFYVI